MLNKSPLLLPSLFLLFQCRTAHEAKFKKKKSTAELGLGQMRVKNTVFDFLSEYTTYF